jgi:hypothetical protein
MIFRHDTRLEDLARTQLELFAADESELLQEAAEAEEAWNRAGRHEAEEAYGDYQLVVDAIADRLLDIRESYAATLDDDIAEAYRSAFNRVAAKRFRGYASLLSDLESD